MVSPLFGKTSFIHYHFPLPDHPMKLHNIGVSELAHDGSLLKELDPVLLQSRRFQCLDGHLHSPTGGLPHPLFHVPKLARTNQFCDPEGKQTKSFDHCTTQVETLVVVFCWYGCWPLTGSC